MNGPENGGPSSAKRFRNWRGRSGGGFQNNGSFGVRREKSLSVQIDIGSDDFNNITAALIKVAPKDARNKFVSVMLDGNEPLPGWKLYFPEQPFTTDSPIVQRIKMFDGHFRRHPHIYCPGKTKKDLWFPLPLDTLKDDVEFQETWPTFLEDLANETGEVLHSAGLAMYILVEKHSEENSSQSPEGSQRMPIYLQMIRPRLQGFGPPQNFLSVQKQCGELVAIKGLVIGTGATEIICPWMAFRCSKCGSQQSVKQPEGTLTFPTSCKSQCRARANFDPLLSSPFTRSIAFQNIQVQENQMGMRFEAMQIPESIDVELKEDLVGSACPGDMVSVTGIVKIRPQESFQPGERTNKQMYIKAVSVENYSHSRSNRKSDEFSADDLRAFKAITEEPNVFRLLVHSLCPAIYGNDVVKAALLLGLFGGSNLGPRSRSQIHILIVGEPGIGKSQMLLACSKVSPRATYVCGGGCTGTGLTAGVSAQRPVSGVGNRTSVNAGALVLADQGVCCIDELDKMPTCHQSLLEVMHNQTVSLAKCGVICSIPARAGVLACANPAGSYYNPCRSLAQNLNLSIAMFSSFDLVLVLLDKANQQMDNLLTSHVQAVFAGKKKIPKSGHFGRADGHRQKVRRRENYSDLESFLKLDLNETIDFIPLTVMQKYIAYARKTVNPILTPDARAELKNFILDLSSGQTGSQEIPVSIRTLDALIRLTQARARLELLSEATREHVLDAIAIVRYSQIDNMENNDSEIQMRRSRTTSNFSIPTQSKKFLKLLQQRAAVTKKKVFKMDELRQIGAHGGFETNLTEIVDTLNHQGFLLMKETNLYQLINM